MGCARPRRVRGGRRVLRDGAAAACVGRDTQHRVRRRIAGLVIFLEDRLRQTPLANVVGALIGGTVGLLLARLIGDAHFWANADNLGVIFLHTLILLALPYIGLVLGAKSGEWLEPERLAGLFRQQSQQQRRYRILDTSVIIDGRIADICETGFVDGTLVVPQFVLKELQQVADSSDSLRRNRGRRGLDILQRIQKMAGVDVIISDADFPDIKEVDLKLIELARSLQGKIVTNDFNLNKVAQLRGVEVLNINELANSLKPVVLPGETMKVFILKEGKEYNQGVAYLDDGTMVVVDNARSMIGKTIDVVVTSVLQTTAGKMIFGRFIDANAQPTPIDRESGDERAMAAEAIPPFHWLRTVFFLIPAISVYTIVLGTLSILSTFVDRQGACGALVRARVVVADSRDHGRRRAA